MSRPPRLAVKEVVTLLKRLPPLVVLMLALYAGEDCEAAPVRTFAPKAQLNALLLEPWKQSLVARMATRNTFVSGAWAIHPDLAGLKPKLREAVLGLVSDAKVETTPLNLSVSYRWDTAATDWMGHRTGGLRRGLHAPAANFSEFRLEVTLKTDEELEGIFNVPQLQTDQFGMTWQARYLLRRLENRRVKGDYLASQFYDEVPLDDAAYLAYDRLVWRGLVKNRLPPGDTWGHPRALTRLEFAVAVLITRQGDGETPPLFTNRNTTMALDYLQGKFAEEFHDLQKPVPVHLQPPGIDTREKTPYQYLAVNFSYGRGVSPVLVARVERVIADYAAEKLRSNSVIVMGHPL